MSNFETDSFIFKMLGYLTLCQIFEIYASQIYSFVFKMFCYLGDTCGKAPFHIKTPGVGDEILIS